MTRRLPSAFATLLLLTVLAGPLAAIAATDRNSDKQSHNTMIMGCWADADKGDGAELKLAFLRDGSLVQYDENQTEKRRRTFGAWEMAPDSSFLIVYWPTGSITRYMVKRIGPILHFSGLFGVASFTLRVVESSNCWEIKE
jgi:hypothetical protein